MPFDLHLTIQDGSTTAYAVQNVAAVRHITREEAATQLLTEAAALYGKKSPAQEMWGAFSSDEDTAITDEAMKHVHAMRQTDRLRDFGV